MKTTRSCALASHSWRRAIACPLRFAAPRRPVTPLVERAAVPPGGPARLALKVSLPESLHTQSNKPLDPTLIPTSAGHSRAGRGDGSTRIVYRRGWN